MSQLSAPANNTRETKKGDSMPKTVKMMVEFDVEIEDEEDPQQITFDIPIEKIIPSNWDGPIKGRVTGYTTQDYAE